MRDTMTTGEATVDLMASGSGAVRITAPDDTGQPTEVYVAERVLLAAAEELTAEGEDTPLPERVAPYGVRTQDTLVYTDTAGCTHEGTITHVGEDGLDVRLDGREVGLSYEALLEAAGEGERVRVKPAAGRVGEGEVDMGIMDRDNWVDSP